MTITRDAILLIILYPLRIRQYLLNNKIKSNRILEKNKNFFPIFDNSPELFFRNAIFEFQLMVHRV